MQCNCKANSLKPQNFLRHKMVLMTNTHIFLGSKKSVTSNLDIRCTTDCVLIVTQSLCIIIINYNKKTTLLLLDDA